MTASMPTLLWLSGRGAKRKRRKAEGEGGSTGTTMVGEGCEGKGEGKCCQGLR
jgi:hypothetical protein